jgi:nucleoside transporter
MADSENKNIMIPLSIMMFLQFFIWGSWYITIPNYLGTVGLGNVAYYAYTAGPLAAMISPFFIGLFADRFMNTEKLLGILFLVAGGLMLYMPKVATMAGTEVNLGTEEAPQLVTEVVFMGATMYKHDLFNYVLLGHMICFMPTLALSASLSFAHLPKGSAQFPLVRAWGTFGWIMAGILLPIFFNQYEVIDGIKQVSVKSEETAGQLWLGGGSAVLVGIFSFFLPKTPAPKKGEKIDVGTLFFMDAWREFKNPSFAVFVICSMLVCIPLQAYYAYLQTQMGAQGFTNISIWKNIGTWLELGMMFMMPFFFRKLGIKKMILIGVGAWVARYALFSWAASAGIIAPEDGVNIGGFQIPFTHMAFLTIVAGVALHGLCYDFFFVTGQVYVDQVTDKRIRGQAQSMIVWFTQGAGMYIGAKVNEQLFNKTLGGWGPAADPANIGTWDSFWMPLCIMAGVILVIFAVAFHPPKGPVKDTVHGGGDDDATEPPPAELEETKDADA